MEIQCIHEVHLQLSVSFWDKTSSVSWNLGSSLWQGDQLNIQNTYICPVNKCFNFMGKILFNLTLCCDCQLPCQEVYEGCTFCVWAQVWVTYKCNSFILIFAPKIFELTNEFLLNLQQISEQKQPCNSVPAELILSSWGSCRPIIFWGVTKTMC